MLTITRMFVKIKKNIPNTITCLNLFLGCIAIVSALNGKLTQAGYLIFSCALLDFLDGFFARLLKAYSEFGKQMDSLADMVSFGLAPSMILYELLIMSLTNQHVNAQFDPNNPSHLEQIILFTPFLVAVFSGLRLARFNITNNAIGFQGLATPASAIFIVSISFLVENPKSALLQSIVLNPFVLLLIICILCVLLVSKLPMFSLKIKNPGFSHNKLQYSFVILSLIIIVLLGVPGVALSIILYILLSLILYFGHQN